jgi:hypothetical protein
MKQHLANLRRKDLLPQLSNDRATCLLCQLFRLGLRRFCCLSHRGLGNTYQDGFSPHVAPYDTFSIFGPIIRVRLDSTRVEPRFIHWTIQASEEVEAYLSEKIRGATRGYTKIPAKAAIEFRRKDSHVLSLQRHLIALLKFAPVESRFCSCKRRGKATFDTPINPCARSACSRSVAVGILASLFIQTPPRLLFDMLSAPFFLGL